MNIIISRVRRFIPQLRLYGFSVAFSAFFFPLNRLFGSKRHYIAVFKHRSILKYLYKRYKVLLKSFIEDNYNEVSVIKDDAIIWVCWWDGEESIPTLVKACYNSIEKHKGNHIVRLITKHNYKEYISIPDYIIEKVNLGIMSITHFSNIVRANLLYDYGGIWLDSTILVLKDIDLKEIAFYTLKAPAKKSVSITLDSYAGLSNLSNKFYFKTKTSTDISRWSGFLLAGTKGSPIFKYFREVLYAYWKDHNDQIDYLLFDYTIALGYDNIPLIKKLIDNVPCVSTEKYELEKHLNKEFKEELFSRFNNTTFHKLSWKKKFNAFTKDNRHTIYKRLINT